MDAGFWGGTRPPDGVPIDPAHPLADRLIGAWAPSSGGILYNHRDLALLPLTVTATTPLIPASRGLGLGCTAADRGATATLPAAQKPGWPQTLAVLVTPIGAPDLNANYIGIPFNNADTTPFCVFQIFQGTANVWGVEWNSGGGLGKADATATTYGRAQLVVAVWQTGSQRLYVDGQAIYSGSAALTNPTYSATSHFALGDYLGVARNSNAIIEWGAWWSRALSPQEVRELTAAPYAMYAPPAWRRYFVPSAATGADFPVSVAGGVTPTGAVVKLVLKVLSGGATPTGVLAKIVLKVLSGGVTPTGALAKVILKIMGGGATPTGALAKVIRKPFSGGVTPTGAVAKIVSKPLSGNVTPTGALAKIVSKPLSGAVTPTGDLKKIVVKPLVGGVTPTGTCARTVRKPLAGGVTPTGTLAITLQRAVSLAGGVTPTGTVAKVDRLSLSGGVTPTGTVIKRVTKLLAGAVTPTGALVKIIRLARSGGVTPSGALTAVIVYPVPSRWGEAPWGEARWGQPAEDVFGAGGGFFIDFFAGQATPTGTLRLTVRLARAGAVAPTGAMRLTLRIVRIGAVTPGGTLHVARVVYFSGSVTPTGATTFPPEWTVANPVQRPGGYPAGTRGRGMGAVTVTEQVPVGTHKE